MKKEYIYGTNDMFSLKTLQCLITDILTGMLFSSRHMALHYLFSINIKHFEKIQESFSKCLLNICYALS